MIEINGWYFIVPCDGVCFNCNQSEHEGGMSMNEVLIKMKMPTSCSVCPMLEGDRLDGLCHAASKWLDDDEYWTWYAYPEGDIDDSKPCDCPLVPIPKHGRLIDADEFLKRAIGTKCFDEDYARMLQELVGESTTIIPASEEGET